MRLSLCATSAARFWGLDRKIVTFLHQNVLINKRYIISLIVFGDDPPGFCSFDKILYPVARVENSSLGKTR
ncbi:hypothetical protein ACLIN3_06870 [Pseudomonas orientalis]|uniref:hypothetical protein n=1 Tax=Pseudomonas orientalis TaxID=76758 RepID=UPI0039884E1A